MHTALDVNGNSLAPRDQALLLATPTASMRISSNTDARQTSTWLYKQTTVLKITNNNRAIVHLDEINGQTPLFEIDSVMLEKCRDSHAATGISK
jgi:hypothetical protein